MNMVSINLMKLVDHKFKQILKIGKKLQGKLADGLILKMTTKLWILNLWKVFGGYLRNCGLKV